MHEDWQSFKNILYELMDLHIPKVKKKVFVNLHGLTQRLCREKERLHQKYKSTDDPDLRLSRYLKFSTARKKFKDIVSKKMDNSFQDDEDSGLISKKFWSYVKATARNTRIPDACLLR